MARVLFARSSTAVTWAAFVSTGTTSTRSTAVVLRHFVPFRGTTGSIRLWETTTQATAHRMTSTTSHDEDGSSGVTSNQSLSGRCLCGNISWKLPNTNKVGQILVCHCTMCRRVSGSVSVPYAALPREPLWAQFSEAQRYVSSGVATRGFCPTCSSTLFMDYGAEHTLWIPLGTMDQFDPALFCQPDRDSQIFLEAKAEYTDALANMPHLPSFGTYRTDPCHPTIPFVSLTPWDQVDSISNHVKHKVDVNPPQPKPPTTDS